MTVDYLKDLFIEKYGEGIFRDSTPEVKVILTSTQYKELNTDLMRKSPDPILLILDQADLKDFNPEVIFYTRIVIPFLCQFIIEVGNDFKFYLADVTQEYGDEQL